VRPISHALPGALAQLLSDAPLSPGKVTFAWNAAVGRAMQRASAVRLERGVLIVDVATPQWGTEVSRSADVILKRLQLLLGPDVVTRIDVRSAPRHA
jgi:hypothetical protein